MAERSAFLERLTRGMVAEALGTRSDRQLVERLLGGRDEAAFEALVRRHGAMVYRVCWRVLHRAPDAEDAFQATFLLLAQKLPTVRNRDSLASWLHGVAHRVALKARAESATRRCRERSAARHAVAVEDATMPEVLAALDAELALLPEKWRLPLILCYLEGRTQDEAADHLGWSKNTLRRRLDEARAALGRRLAQRGIGWPAALAAALVADCTHAPALPPALVSSTVGAAKGVAAGRTLPPPFATLTKGVVSPMPPTKLQFVSVALLALAAGVLAMCAHRTATQGPDAGPEPARVAPPEPLDLRTARTVPAEEPKNPVPEGTWLVDVKEGELHDEPLAIIRTENGADGKVHVTVTSTLVRDLQKIRDVTVEGRFLKLTVQTARGDWYLEAVLPAKDEKTMLGSLNINSQIFPAAVSPTDKTELKPAPVVRAGNVEYRKDRAVALLQVREIHQLHHLARALRGQASSQTDADKAAELRKKADESEREAAKKAPKLFDELLETHADDPAVIHTAFNVLKILGKVPYDRPQVQRIVGLTEKAARAYGPAMSTEVRLRLATALTEIDGAALDALEFTRGLEKELGEKGNATALARILHSVRAALRKAGRNAEAATVTARINELDEILDTEYRAKVPPFKPEKYAGRTTQSRRVVVVELFTGTQCGPCVAADVAFGALAQTYQPTELALLQYHVHIPGPDPLASAETQKRWEFYSQAHPDQVVGTPTTLFNGTPGASSGGGLPQSKDKYDQYRKIIDPLLDATEEVQLSATAARRGNAIEIGAEVRGLKNAGPNKKLRFLLVEESVRYAARNGLRLHHNVVRAFPGGVEGIALREKDAKHTASVDLGGLRKALSAHLDAQAKVREFPDAERPLALERLKVVALVQDDKTSAILQAVEVEVGSAPEK